MKRINNFLARGTLVIADTARKLQALQLRLTAGEVKGGVEHFEPYGYSSHPLGGAEALLGFVGGDRSHCVAVVVTDRRFRPKDLQPGEVCLFTDEGDEIRLSRGRVVKIVAGSKLEITAPEAVFKCSSSVTIDAPKLKVTGDIEDGHGSMQEMRDIFNAHTHPENGSAGPTDPPTGKM